MRVRSNVSGTIRVNGPGTVSCPKNLCIGDNTHFAGHYYINALGSITIGENCHFSRNFTCYSCNHNYKGDAIPYDSSHILKPVIIEDNVWVGMNVSIVPGVQVGEGAIIGMGSVVVENVPPLAIVGGNPAKILKYRDADHYGDLVSKGRFGGANGHLVLKKLGTGA